MIKVKHLYKLEAVNLEDFEGPFILEVACLESGDLINLPNPDDPIGYLKNDEDLYLVIFENVEVDNQRA